MPRRRLIDTERGVTSIELAFIAPSLIGLIFLVIQASFYFYGRSVAEQAAREGVSQLRLDQTRSAYDGNHLSIEKNVVDFANNIGGGALHVDSVLSTYDDRNGTVTVTVKGSAVSLTGLTITIDQSVTGEIERFRDFPVRRRERGSLSIEYVILTPFVFLVFGLLYAFGRVAAVDSSLDADTRDAARAASLAPDLASAQAAAVRAFDGRIGAGTSTCASTLDVSITGRFAPGGTITVHASCKYELSDVLVVPSVVAGGDITVDSQFSVVIDPNRSLGG